MLTPTGGLSTGTANGSFINSLLETTRLNGAEHRVLSREELAERYPQHNLRPTTAPSTTPAPAFCAATAPSAPAVSAAQANGATVLQNTPVDSITETDHGVVVTSGDRTWTFEKVIVASGGWSRRLMPDHLKAVTETHRIVLTWFVAQDCARPAVRWIAFVPCGLPSSRTRCCYVVMTAAAALPIGSRRPIRWDL